MFKIKKILFLSVLLFISVIMVTKINATEIFIEKLPGAEDIVASSGSFDPSEILKNFVNWLIKTSVGIGSMIAVVIIMIGGIQYITTDSFSKKSDGKKYITNAIMGLVFLVGGYLIFLQINPTILGYQFNQNAYQVTAGGGDSPGGNPGGGEDPGGGGTKPSGGKDPGSGTEDPGTNPNDPDQSPEAPEPMHKPEEAGSVEPEGINKSPDEGIDKAKKYTQMSNMDKDLFDTEMGRRATGGKTYGLTNKLRRSHFMAQVAHETGNFHILVERGYHLDRAKQVFAKKHHHCLTVDNPSAIFNCVYGNRLGNGPPSSGDGSRYRGRGWMQLTGKTNYAKFTTWHKKHFSKEAGIDFVKNPQLVAKYPYAMRSALFEWDTHRLNRVADRGGRCRDVKAVTKVINGGYNGLADRKAKFRKYYGSCSQE